MKKILVLIVVVLLMLDVLVNAQTVVDKGFEISYIKPVRIEKIADNHYFFDFGKDAFGTIVLKLNEPQKETLILHLGEKLADNGIIDKNNIGTIRYSKQQLSNLQAHQTYTVQLKADKRNTSAAAILLPDSFGVISPFRYCEIENLTIPISEFEIFQKSYNYAFNDNASSFTSSDTILNQVWDMCKYTIKATSFTGLYIDGDRERIPYEADAYINQLSHYCVDSDYFMARVTNEYFMMNATWPTEWLLHNVLLFYNDYMYTGSLEPIIKNYEMLKKKMLMSLEDENHLLNIKPKEITTEFMKSVGFTKTTRKMENIVDWPVAERDGYDMKDVNTVVNSFYYQNLKLMSEMADAIDKKKDAQLFYNKSVLVKNAMNEKLLDKIKGIYVDGENSTHSSLHANMFPLAFGIVPEANQQSVVSFIKSRAMACSVYGAQYLLEALYNAGESSYALSLMNSTTDRSWWNMIRVGSTMALEAWDMKFKPNADWNHAWGAAPANIVTRNMWGIRPVKPGFTVTYFRPQMAELKSSSIKVPTIKGEILAEYTQLDKNTKSYKITLPKGIKGIYVSQNATINKLFINNKQVSLDKKNHFITDGETTIIETIK